jgi:moderate conductance mechanosensitive channel
MLKESIPQLLKHLGLNNPPAWLEFLISISNIFLIIIFAWLIHRLLYRLIHAAHIKLMNRQETADDQRRMETLERVTQYIATVVLLAITIMLVLSEFGISIAPILATAGVAGLAVGFGAQSLVKDYFTGFVMLIENQIRVGDVIEVASKSGVVEELTLRYVRLRDYEGSVHFVPNGAIDTVTNRSRVFAYAVMDISVAYKEELENIYGLMREVAQKMRQTSGFSEKILEDLEIAGVEQWADSAIIIRCRLKTVALEQFAVRREFLQQLKMSFDLHGVEIPYPHRTVYTLPAEQASQNKLSKSTIEQDE